MSLRSHIKKLREKPQAVRERILIVTLAILAPLLLAGGVFAFLYERKGEIHEEVFSAKNLSEYFSGTTKEFKQIQNPFKATPVPTDPVATQ